MGASVRLKDLAWAVVTLVLLGAFHVLRYAAGQCTGAGCDAYIPLSLLLPLATWLAAVVASLSAYLAASRADRSWQGVLALTTLLAVFGPIVSLLLLRDSPDVFVPVGTALVTIVALIVLTYYVSRRSAANGLPTGGIR